MIFVHESDDADTPLVASFDLPMSIVNEDFSADFAGFYVEMVREAVTALDTCNRL